MITFITIILYLRAPNGLTLIGITSIFACILPLIMVGALFKLDLIDDYYAAEKETRYIPFLWTDLFYLAGTMVLFWLEAPSAVTALMACYFVNGFILLLITFKYKISIHASGITGPVTALVYIIGITMIPLFLTVLPVAWARVELKAHTKMQVTTGAILTTLLTWIQMSVYLHNFFF
jgi:membrane-associated phospholipid phosphatase